MKHLIKASLRHLKNPEIAGDKDSAYVEIVKKFINDLNISPKGTMFTSEGDAVLVKFKSHVTLNFTQYFKAIKSFPFSKGYHGSIPTRAETSKYDLAFFGLDSDDNEKVAEELNDYFKVNSH